LSDYNVKGNFPLMKMAKIDLAQVRRDVQMKIEITPDQAARMAELFKQVIVSKGRQGGKEMATSKQLSEAKKKIDADPTVPMVGDKLKYVIWDVEYGSWVKGPAFGHVSQLNQAYRYTLNEMVEKGYYQYMVPVAGGEPARLVAMPCPEWAEALTCVVYDEEADEFLSQLADDVGNLCWSDNEDDAQEFTLADARIAVGRVRQAYLNDDEDLKPESVNNIRAVCLPSGPVPDEVLTFAVTKESALYNREGVEAAAKKVEEAFKDKPFHYTGSYNEEDPVDEFTDALGQHLYNVHLKEDCVGGEGGHCPIHNDSLHHMNTWPLVWNQKDKTFMRQCEHGGLHPDPDDKRVHEDPMLGNHACCDFVCCVNLPAMEAMADAF
jgi:hypothetical protein